jgi:dihydrofolate reductase
MRVIYYVASSADGFIAGPRGDISWLDPYNSPRHDYGYARFYKSVDELVMGSGTFKTALRFKSWPYPDRPVSVFTRKNFGRLPVGVRLVRTTPSRWRGRGTVWLVGGGKLAGSFLNAGLIDELRLFVVPIVLGSGVPLFHRARRRPWRLIHTETFSSGIVELRYR